MDQDLNLSIDKDSVAVRVVDDDPSVRRSWSFLLEGAGWNVRSYGSAKAFLQLDDLKAPGCLVLDVRMPEISGLDLQHELKSRGATIPIIFVSAHGDIDMAVQALKDGASDFLPKPVKAERMIAAIENAVKKDLEQRKTAEGIASAKTLWDSLTAREKEIARGVANGLLNKQIADQLGITEKTVQAHRGSVCRKLCVKRGAEIAALLIEIGEKKS